MRKLTRRALALRRQQMAAGPPGSRPGRKMDSGKVLTTRAMQRAVESLQHPCATGWPACHTEPKMHPSPPTGAQTMKFAWSPLPLLALLGVSAAAAQPVCPGYSVCPTVNPKVVLAQPLAQAVLATIDATEAQAVQNANANGINFNQLLAFLGQAIANDRTLSVNRTEACTLCHRDATGFAGGIPAFTRV